MVLGWATFDVCDMKKGITPNIIKQMHKLLIRTGTASFFYYHWFKEKARGEYLEPAKQLMEAVLHNNL